MAFTLKGMDTLSRKTTHQNYFTSVLKRGPILKGKNLLLGANKFFSLRIKPFSERTWVAGKQTGNHKGYLHYKKLIKNLTSLLSSP